MGELTEEQKAYQRAYYRKHRKARRAYKLKKYRTDPDYRKAALRRAKAQGLVRHVQNQLAARVIKHGGEEESIWHMADLERRVMRDRVSLLVWHKAGIIPKPLYKDTWNNGMYAESQIKYLAEIVRRVDEEGLVITNAELKRVLRKVWKVTYSSTKLNAELRAINGNKKEGTDKESKGTSKEEEGCTARNSVRY